ncbi:hypothetical protein H2Z55_001274 [Campylobacter jejuni]|uniref:DUF6402 family protein n=1 Tax=Campylobacter jejuni TaxID=197 RepID=UPI000D3027AD|nr:hypothetical protein [Campylobacter jejuni]EAJ2681671.1 hypothetical protein [Campylobacter jejuni]EDO8589641.1 hypothetical protein [Campylobacter jejuni]EDP0020300.1 hypothetical protein [Campylobacter jejuni]EDP3738459.1 hypothetical protein [Campylobacter jejuni]EDP4343393.1 hypothetical protein [Campylobacter jejuni]
MEALNQKNSLNIRLLSSNNILLHNQEFKLYEIAQGNKNEIKTIFTTNKMGEAHLNASEIFSKEAQSFELILNQSSVYKNKPIYNHRFLLRSYEYGHWCEIKFERKADKGSINSIRLKSKEFTLENNEKIVRNFYTFGDIVEFEAIYEDTKIKEEQIKWGYVFIQDKNTLDKLNKNQLTNDKKESSLFDEEILKDCFYIEKEEDKALLSSSIIYRHLENNKAYCGKHLSLQLPNPKDTQEQKTLLVFAYKEIPNYNASYLIRINDYPQITIDCTLAETLRAHTNKDEISRLGWGVSYICQRLWHDNSSDAKELKDLTFRSSTSQDFIDTIPNETMKTIVKEILPRVEMQQLKTDNTKSRDKARFYAELDWDSFYMKFPIMQELKGEHMNLKKLFGEESDFQKQFEDFLNDTLLDIKNIKNTQEYTMALNIQAMKENKTKNAEVFKLYKKEETLPETHKAIKDLQKPSDIIDNSLYFQRFDIKNDVFLPHLGLSKFDAFSLQNSIQHEKEVLDKFHSNPKYKQNFALYSIAGAFNILYIPSLIQITRVTRFYNYHSLYAACKKVRAFIIDTVNFNNNGSDQPIGAWDYEKVGFDLYNSIMQYRNTKFHFKYTSPKSFLFPLYNSDFLKTKQYFNLGLDFFLYSSTFLDMDFSHTQMQDTAFIVGK